MKDFIKAKKLRDSWSNFGLSYFKIAELSCDVMKKSADEERDAKILDLYMPTLFNIKHGIEIFLKCFIVILEENELEKNKQHHRQSEIFKEIIRLVKTKKIENVIQKASEKNKNRKDWKRCSERVQDFDKKLENLESLISRYQTLQFLKSKIANNFSIEDSENTAFKYPQNNLQVHLDYGKILKNITEEDIDDLCKDIRKLQSVLIDFWMIFYCYIEIKNTLND